MNQWQITYLTVTATIKTCVQLQPPVHQPRIHFFGPNHVALKRLVFYDLPDQSVKQRTKLEFMFAPRVIANSLENPNQALKPT